jgi:hypothetical protein
MKKLAADSTFERIRSYYLSDNVTLSPSDEDVRKRWAAAFSYTLDERKTDTQVVKFLVVDFGISESQAYRDLANAKNLFSDARKATKEALRHMVTQWAIEAFDMARTKKDFKGMEKMLNQITKANNLDKEDMDLPDPSTWNPPTQLINIDFNFFYSDLGKFVDDSIKNDFNKLIVQINKLVEKSPIKNYFQPFKTIDITHEDVKDEPADGN